MPDPLLSSIAIRLGVDDTKREGRPLWQRWAPAASRPQVSYGPVVGSSPACIVGCWWLMVQPSLPLLPISQLSSWCCPVPFAQTLSLVNQPKLSPAPTTVDLQRGSYKHLATQSTIWRHCYGESKTRKGPCLSFLTWCKLVWISWQGRVLSEARLPRPLAWPHHILMELQDAGHASPLSLFPCLPRGEAVGLTHTGSL